jgi:hypothetical protein
MKKIIKEGNKRYLITEKRDIIILNKIKQLERKKLEGQDKEKLKFIKTQMEADWRKYLINCLDKLLKKYKR